MSSPPRLLLLCLLLLLVGTSSSAQQGAATPVPSDQLEKGALKLPVGTLGLPEPEWTWHAFDGAYIAFPDADGDDRRVAAVYLPFSMSGSKDDLEAMLRNDVLAGTPEQKKKTRISLRQSKEAPFGKMYEFEFTDADGSFAGVAAMAQGHSLLLNCSGKNAKALREAALREFRPSQAVLAAGQVSSLGFLDKSEEVPGYQMQGNRLSLPGGTIATPVGWSWRQISAGSSKVYVCHEGSRFIIVINWLQKENLREVATEFSKGLLSRASGSLEEKVDYVPSSLPFPGSEKLTLTYTLAGEPFLKVGGYLGYDGRQSLVLLGVGDEVPEKELDLVASSFEEDRGRPETTLAVFVFMLGLGFLVLGFIVNRATKRPAFNGAKVALVLSVLAMVLGMVVAASGRSYDLSYAVGLYFWHILLFGWLASKHDKRRAQWKAQQERPSDFS